MPRMDQEQWAMSIRDHVLFDLHEMIDDSEEVDADGMSRDIYFDLEEVLLDGQRTRTAMLREIDNALDRLQLLVEKNKGAKKKFFDKVRKDVFRIHTAMGSWWSEMPINEREHAEEEREKAAQEYAKREEAQKITEAAAELAAWKKRHQHDGETIVESAARRVSTLEIEEGRKLTKKEKHDVAAEERVKFYEIGDVDLVEEVVRMWEPKLVAIAKEANGRGETSHYLRIAITQLRDTINKGFENNQTKAYLRMARDSLYDAQKTAHARRTQAWGDATPQSLLIVHDAIADINEILESKEREPEARTGIETGDVTIQDRAQELVRITGKQIDKLYKRAVGDTKYWLRIAGESLDVDIPKYYGNKILLRDGLRHVKETLVRAYNCALKHPYEMHVPLRDPENRAADAKKKMVELGHIIDEVESVEMHGKKPNNTAQDEIAARAMLIEVNPRRKKRNVR